MNTYPARSIPGLLVRFMAALAGPLGVSALHADPYSSPPALPPADIATLQITATPERTSYRLGETVRVRYAVANHGTETITIRRDNDTAFWRAESLHVLAFGADTGAPVPAVSGGIDLLNYRYGRRASVAPGETWEHVFFPLRHVELPGPGRYRFQLRHTLGWPDASTAPAAPEFVLEFTAPGAAEAAEIVESLPPLGTPKDDAPLSVDTCGFNYPVYLPYLVKRIAAGEPALLDSLERMATPEATAALIELSSNAHASVAQAARHKLLVRLPEAGGAPAYLSMSGPPFSPDQRRLAWQPAQVLAARTLARSLIAEELPPPDSSGIVSAWDSPAFIAAALLARFGEASDLPLLAQGMERVAYERPLGARAYHHHGFEALDGEIGSYRLAYAAMHARGVRAPFVLNGLGEAILAFDESRLGGSPANLPKLFEGIHSSVSRTNGPRSPAWFEQLDLLANRRPWPAGLSGGERPGCFGNPAEKRPPHPMLLVAALDSIPASCPDACVPFVEFALGSDVPQVIHAACAVAVETRSKVFMPAMRRVLRTEANPDVRATVAKALAQSGDRLSALRELSGDLAVTPEPARLIQALSAILFGGIDFSSSCSIPELSRDERLALCEAWQTFVQKNEARLAQADKFAPGDPDIPVTLFANTITWKLPGGQTWPARQED